MVLLFQEFFQLFIRRFQGGGGFLNLFHEKAGRDVDADDITKILLERPIRNVTPAFQIGGERDHIGTEESGFFDIFGKFDVVVALAVLAPVHQLLIFRDAKRFFDEFGSGESQRTRITSHSAWVILTFFISKLQDEIHIFFM